MKIEELETASTQAEQMANTALAIAGKHLLPESARNRLTREFRSGARLIRVIIDSENIRGQFVVLAAHGYAIKDGKLVSLPADQKDIQEGLLREMQAVKFKDHLAVRQSQDAKGFTAILTGEDGGVMFECDYAKCLEDVEVLIAQLDFQDLDSFARSHFVKTKN